MAVEPAADHVVEFGPVEERVVAGVRADEALAIVADKGEEVLLLLRRQVVAGAEVKDRVEIVEVVSIARGGRDRLSRDPLRVGAKVEIEGAGFASDAAPSSQARAKWNRAGKPVSVSAHARTFFRVCASPGEANSNRMTRRLRDITPR